MNVISIDESNYDEEYQASCDAVRDFLYMYFEISSDCRPTGDFDRAELGSVDAYRFIDITYEYKWLFRNDAEMRFIHEAAAINLLCRLAQVHDRDECSGSTSIVEFANPQQRRSNEEALRKQAPDLFKIEDALLAGRIVNRPSIHEAFAAGFGDTDSFCDKLHNVLDDVILNAFDALGK